MTTETKDQTAFDKMMAESTAVQARFDAGAEKIIAHAESLGATVTKEEVYSMPSLQMYALGAGDALSESEAYERELYAIPQIRDAKRRAAMAEEIKAGEGAAHDELERMRPADRMEWARQNLGIGNSEAASEAAPISTDEKLRILLSMPVRRQIFSES